ncbi:MAG: S-formylglutathione hydrolase, partial [Alphaproteobacteria bacterium]|nr:S-formylglutathione hydrolase [Alphaproteobacteria bacterium]
MTLQILSDTCCFGGRQLRLSHASEACHCDMIFSAFLPTEAETGPVPTLIWLSGLTCNDENFP